MRYLSLPAWRDGRPLYLAELMLALGWSAAGLVWRCHALEIGPGPEVAPLEAAASSGESLTSLELLHLATPYVQVIEGAVTGYEERDEQVQPVVVLRAVDSTSWDLEIYAEAAYQRIVAAFPEAVELDPKLLDT